MYDLLMLVVTHKKIDEKVNDRTYIKVGNESFLCDLSDNNGDNISNKNSSFCELTALYYAYKNLEYDYLSLEHYRRFFLYKNKLISKRDMLNLLDQYDVILPIKNYLTETNYEHYTNNEHKDEYENDIKVLREVFLEKYPNEIKAFDQFFSSKESYYYNMMASNKDFINGYLNWLFDILFEVENRLDISNYDNYHKRVFGFLSERLLNIYLLMNPNLKVKELEMGMLGDNLFKRKLGLVKNKIRKFIK